MSRTGTLVKMFIGGAVICIGGPALVMYVMPTEEELFKKYNPDLQRRSLEGREKRQKDFDDFVKGLKEHSKSDRNMWIAMQEAQDKAKRDQA